MESDVRHLLMQLQIYPNYIGEEFSLRSIISKLHELLHMGPKVIKQQDDILQEKVQGHILSEAHIHQMFQVLIQEQVESVIEATSGLLHVPSQ